MDTHLEYCAQLWGEQHVNVLDLLESKGDVKIKRGAAPLL